MTPITTYSYPCRQEGVSFPHAAEASFLTLSVHCVNTINAMQGGRHELRYHLSLYTLTAPTPRG
eukprot:scaffold158923_cov16-Prasinocladus_malaysianus.AAC.1